jgi:hypothetical protein
MLYNERYVGRVVWNRKKFVKGGRHESTRGEAKAGE